MRHPMVEIGTFLWCLLFPVTGLIGQQSVAQKPQLRTELLEARALTRPAGVHSAVTLGPAGEVYSLNPRDWMVHKTSARSERWLGITLEGVPERRTFSRCSLLDDIHVDTMGDLYVPATWRQSVQATWFGLFVFDSRGLYKQTVVLDPATEIRRFEVDSSGNIFVLGIDPAFFRDENASCLLVHKYSREGKRVDSFSECPAGLDLRRSDSVRPGPDFERLKAEVDRGHLWLQGTSVYHVLPRSRLLRIFNTEGDLQREFALEPPGEASNVTPNNSFTNISIWNVFPVSDGRYFIDWAAYDVDGRLQMRYLSLHDSEGAALTAGRALEPFTVGTPLVADGQGNCYFLRASKSASGGFQLVRARVAVEP